MAKSTILKQTARKKSEIIINAFAGIDRSTARFRIEGSGERLYEARNVFPYIQGELLRRRDAVETNSRASDAAFPSFPAASNLVGDPIIKKVVEFNDAIVIIYEDDGAKGILFLDSIDVGANTINNRISETTNGGGAFTFTADGKMDAVVYGNDDLFICLEGNKFISIDTGWTSAQLATGNAGDGNCEVFLQSLFHVNSSAPQQIFGRTAPAAGVPDAVTYSLMESPGKIIKLLALGYQTSSAGATTVFLLFKPSSIWVLTGIGATESIEQVTGNIGLTGSNAVTYTPFGVCFVGRDTDGLLNLYLLDRNSLVLHTIGHELYEELNDIPKDNYDDIVLSFHRNRMVRIAITKTGDAVANNQEYWMDFYNGLKKRTLWGPMPLPASNILSNTVSFSGGTNPVDSGFFMFLKEGSAYKLYEDVDTDTFNSTDTEWDDQVWRTKMYDFGRYYGIINRIVVVAKDNGAKFKVYHEVPKLNGSDDDTTQTLIGSFQMGTSGSYRSIPIRIIPALLRNQIGIKIESDYDGVDNNPLELSQIGIEYEVTKREVVE